MGSRTTRPDRSGAADARLRHHRVRRDVGPGRADRGHQPGPGLPGPGRPAEVAEAAIAAIRAGTQPVPARAGHPRAPPGHRPRTSTASTASSSTPTTRSWSPPAPPRPSPPRCWPSVMPATRWWSSSRSTTPTGRPSPWPGPAGGWSRWSRRAGPSIRTGWPPPSRPDPPDPAQHAPQPDRQGLQPVRARDRRRPLPSSRPAGGDRRGVRAPDLRRPHVPLCTLEGMAERTLTVSSAGKTFSFTGWKVGWVCGPARLVAAVRTVKQFLTYVNGAPFQPAVAAGLDLPDAYFTGAAAALRQGRDRLCAGLADGRLRGLPAPRHLFHGRRAWRGLGPRTGWRSAGTCRTVGRGRGASGGVLRRPPSPGRWCGSPSASSQGSWTRPSAASRPGPRPSAQPDSQASGLSTSSATWSGSGPCTRSARLTSSST